MIQLERTSLSCFGKFLQEGTLGERMCLPWLRPFQNAKHSSKAAARAGTSSLPAAFRKCYEISAIWFVNHMIEQILERV